MKEKYEVGQKVMRFRNRKHGWETREIVEVSGRPMYYVAHMKWAADPQLTKVGFASRELFLMRRVAEQDAEIERLTAVD